MGSEEMHQVFSSKVAIHIVKSSHVSRSFCSKGQTSLDRAQLPVLLSIINDIPK